uniref:Uncharacterized protein n=1 Tax=Rhizophora mucronata TaxID=61149 RepID=A0A2P2Q2G5_RHIMU
MLLRQIDFPSSLFWCAAYTFTVTPSSCE